jgi:hypothetical protein
MSAPAAEQAVWLAGGTYPLSPGEKKRKLWIGRRWGKARSSFKPQTSPLVTVSRLTATATATWNCSSTSATLHSTAQHSTAQHSTAAETTRSGPCARSHLAQRRPPRHPPSTRPVSDHHRPPTKSLETRLLLARRGRHLRYEVPSGCLDHSSLTSEPLLDRSAASWIAREDQNQGGKIAGRNRFSEAGQCDPRIKPYPLWSYQTHFCLANHTSTA